MIKPEDKINQLLNSQTPENNYIALCLMMDVLDWSFETAFLKIPYKRIYPRDYVIELPDILIQYTHERQIMADYIYIFRAIYHKNQLIKDAQKEIYFSGDTFNKNLSLGLNDEENKCIKDDLKKIAPRIKTLFYQ